MNCTAKIKDEFNNRYSCKNETKLRITVINNKTNNMKVKHLCIKHAKRSRLKINYENKHCGKDISYSQEYIQTEGVKK